MRIIMAGLLFLNCCGCTGGIYSNLAEVEIRLASPKFGAGQRVPVVYPGRGEVADDLMSKNVELPWRSMERDYSGYNFNP